MLYFFFHHFHYFVGLIYFVLFSFLLMFNLNLIWLLSSAKRHTVRNHYFKSIRKQNSQNKWIGKICKIYSVIYTMNDLIESNKVLLFECTNKIYWNELINTLNNLSSHSFKFWRIWFRYGISHIINILVSLGRWTINILFISGHNE